MVFHKEYSLANDTLVHRSVANDMKDQQDDAVLVKQDMYRHLVVAARYFAERARAVEERTDHDAHRFTAGGAASVRHRSYVMGAILSAAAYLEASINELYLELHNSRGLERARLPRRVLSGLGRFWTDIKRADVLRRYQVVLMVADAERFDERRAPFLDADTLMKLREALVHCRPERAESRRRVRTLEQRLRDRMPASPFAAADSLWFPDQCLSAACAEWAVHTVDEFSDAFCKRMALPARGLARSEGPPRQRTQSQTVPVRRDSSITRDETLPNDIPSGNGR